MITLLSIQDRYVLLSMEAWREYQDVRLPAWRAYQEAIRMPREKFRLREKELKLWREQELSKLRRRSQQKGTW